MIRNIHKNWYLTELFLPLLTLMLLIFFTLGIFLWAPYLGFYFNPTTGQVSGVFVPASDPNQPTLQVDDVIQKIGPLTWDEYHKSGDKPFFEGVQPGNSVEIVVKRADKPVTIQWVLPGFNFVELRERLLGIWWIPYIFWLCGTFTQLFMRPKDLRWRFFVLFNYLTAIWLIVGDLSLWRILASSLLLHALSWLVVPFYWGFHWAFPKPLGHVPRPVTMLLFVSSVALALAEMFQTLPRQAYALGVLLAFGGSIVFLFAHLIWQRDYRREVQRLGLVLAIILIPLLLLMSVLAYFGSLSAMAPLAFLPLPLMPAAYFYSIYRDRLGNFELRANRAISICVFLIFLLIVDVFVSAPFLPAQVVSETALIVVLSNTVCAAMVAILVFPHFQAWLERHVLGIRLPQEKLPEAYAARILTSTTLLSLTSFLQDQVFPSFLIKQFVFLGMQTGTPKYLLIVGVPEDIIPSGDNLSILISSQPGKYHPPENKTSNDWVRLVLPLIVDDELLGIWLLGQHDPDDVYSRSEILVLQTLADQTAIAFSNILHIEHLQAIYQTDNKQDENPYEKISQPNAALTDQTAIAVSNTLHIEKTDNKPDENLSEKISQPKETPVDKPKVFISYCKEDFEKIKEIYSIIQANNCIPWIDKFDLIPGQDWEMEIHNSIKTSNFFLACLSENSVSKHGYFQKELKKAYEILEEYPDGAIYLIPIRLDECIVPIALAKKQWLDWSHSDAKEKLLRALGVK